MKELSVKRKELYIFLILGLFLIVFLQFLLGIPGLAIVSFVILLSLVGLFLLFAGTVRWKLLSYFFFLWLLLEGIFRKWILPDYSTFIFFVKHLILLGPYFYIFNKGIKISKRYYPFLGFLLLYVAWGVLEAFNFRGTTDFRVHILGLITHFWFVPLIFLIPTVFDTEEKIVKFFRIMVYVSFPIFILGILQYFSPQSSPINRYAPNEAVGDMFIAMVDYEHVRITGVFSYMTPYKTYLGVLINVILCLLVIGRISRVEKLILCLALCLATINMIMIGSRGGVLFLLINSSLFVLFYLSLKGRLKVKKKVFIRFALIVLFFVLSAILLTPIGREAASALIFRIKLATGDEIPRILLVYTPHKFLPDAGLVGYGIGTAYQGSNALVKDWGDMPRRFEAEWDRVILEFGLIGFVIVMILRAYIFFYVWKVFRRIKSSELKLLVLLVILHQIPVFLGLNIVFDYFQSILYWSFIGLLVAVTRLERNNATKSYCISPR